MVWSAQTQNTFNLHPQKPLRQVEVSREQGSCAAVVARPRLMNEAGERKLLPRLAMSSKTKVRRIALIAQRPCCLRGTSGIAAIQSRTSHPFLVHQALSQLRHHHARMG